MIRDSADVLVAGLICLDLILDFESPSWGHEGLDPGSLHLIDGLTQSTGGVVANTGLALHKLGVSTSLIGKVGTDLFGLEILRQLNAADPKLTRHMIQSPEDQTSFSVVINPKNRDRSFLHMPGANDTFCDSDMQASMFHHAKLLHFGYPPIMKTIRQHQGASLKAIFEQARSQGLATSLDMCDMAPGSEGAKVNWPVFLANVLPTVDLFMPSLEELRVMLGATQETLTWALLHEFSDRLLGMGTAAVLIKLGANGLYLRTTKDSNRLNQLTAILPDPAQRKSWQGCELVTPAYEVQVAGTTGAGDCAIAGFISALLKRGGPKQALELAAAVAAFCVEKPDAVSGVPCWDEVVTRLDSAWPTLPSCLD